MIRITAQNNNIQKLLLVCINDEWTVAGLDTAGKFFRLIEEEGMTLEQAQKINKMALDAMRSGFADLNSLKDWINDQVSEVLHLDTRYAE